MSFIEIYSMLKSENIDRKCQDFEPRLLETDTVVQITMDLEQDIKDYHVIIVEDIIDTGRTLNDIVKLLKGRKPLSLRVVTLLDKPSRRVVDFEADISLFTIPDYFVIGYGLDCGELYRNLPYIAEYNND